MGLPFRGRRAPESAEVLEWRLARQRARKRQRLASGTVARASDLPPKQQSSRETGACLNAELGTGRCVHPARRHRVRHASSRRLSVEAHSGLHTRQSRLAQARFSRQRRLEASCLRC